MNTKGDGLLFTDRLNLYLSNSGMKKKKMDEIYSQKWRPEEIIH